MKYSLVILSRIMNQVLQVQSTSIILVFLEYLTSMLHRAKKLKICMLRIRCVNLAIKLVNSAKYTVIKMKHREIFLIKLISCYKIFR